MNDSATPGGPKKLGDLLGLIMARYGYAQSAGRAELERVWKEIAGERVREHTRLGSIRRGILEVAVDSHALLADLEGFEKHDLLEKLQEKLGPQTIKGIKFRRL
jgi:predicted nucleic acid-binding Zn ribbon protein